MHAPWLMALVAGAVVGMLAQRSRLCMAGGIRDLFLIRDPHLFRGFVMILWWPWCSTWLLAPSN